MSMFYRDAPRCAWLSGDAIRVDSLIWLLVTRGLGQIGAWETGGNCNSLPIIVHCTYHTFVYKCWLLQLTLV